MKLQFFSAAIMLCVAMMFTSCDSTTKTDSGLEYKHHVKNGGEKPKVGDWVSFKFDYSVNDSLIQPWRADAEAILRQMPDSSAKDPNIQFFFDALANMSEGDSLSLFVPIDSLPQKPQDLKPGDVLKFDLVLLDIITNEEKMAADAEKQKEFDAKVAGVKEEISSTTEAYKANTLGDKLITTASGLKYVVHEMGTGAKAAAGETVSVNYYGMLLDGTPFDDSYKTGNPFNFPVAQNQVIAGWDEALSTLPAGTRFTVFIPSNLAYGENGAPPVIPANAELVFHINFLEILAAQ
jgi:FKBP-type peptidyl-prolyl cis-trans isomerase FkpA